MRLIDADSVKENIDKNRPGRCYEDAWTLTVIDNTPTIQAVPIEVLQEIRQEIEEKYDGCDICEWFEDYDYEGNNISEYCSVGSIKDIFEIFNKHIKEYTE